MKIPIYNQEGKTDKSINLSKDWSDLEVSPDLIHQVVQVEKSNQRRPWAKTKDRSEVRGGGKKPWRQKGTGRARHGSNRSPIWQGGGITFGPNPKKNSHRKVNKKMKQLALIGILKEKMAKEAVVVIEKIELKEPKTNLLKKIIDNVFSDKQPSSLLLIADKVDKNLRLSSRNISFLNIANVNSLSPLKLLRPSKILITKNAFSQVVK